MFAFRASPAVGAAEEIVIVGVVGVELDGFGEQIRRFLVFAPLQRRLPLRAVLGRRGA